MLGHQPAIAANCEVDPITTELIEEAIFSQKIGAGAKQLKAYKEEKSRGEAAGDMLLIKARIDFRSCPRWVRQEMDARVRTNTEVSGATAHPPTRTPLDGGVGGPDAGGGGAGRGSNSMVQTAGRESPMAKVRMLSCPTYKGPIDTTAMQLYTKEGFRDIHCKACGFHGRAKGIKCQCNLVWRLRAGT